MAYRKKAKFILPYEPDILIIQECEHPEKLVFSSDVKKPTDIVWYGVNKNKGIAVISYSNHKVRLLDIHEPNIKTILPIVISNETTDYNLLAVWAYNRADPGYTYVGQVWKAIDQYEDFLSKENVIIAGDFNSNVFWDKLKRKVTHSRLVERLTAMSIHSVYHSYNRINQGQEQHPTFYMYRHHDKPYHIDYGFISEDLITRLDSVEIGKYEDWHKHSDHCPLLITLNE